MRCRACGRGAIYDLLPILGTLWAAWMLWQMPAMVKKGIEDMKEIQTQTVSRLDPDNWRVMGRASGGTFDATIEVKEAGK